MGDTLPGLLNCVRSVSEEAKKRRSTSTRLKKKGRNRNGERDAARMVERQPLGAVDVDYGLLIGQYMEPNRRNLRALIEATAYGTRVIRSL